MTPQAAAELLQVSLDIDKAELKKLYKQLVLKFHPDRNHSPNAHDIFIQIKEAYETLLAYVPISSMFTPGDFAIFGNETGTVTVSSANPNSFWFST